jgi:hypothetical protein
MKPHKLGTVFPHVEAIIKHRDGHVLWCGLDAPNPIARGLQALVRDGYHPDCLVIREGYYPGFGDPIEYSAAGHEYLTRLV